MDRTGLPDDDVRYSKARFALAVDPDRALRDFFAEFESEAAGPAPPAPAALAPPNGRKLPLLLISQLPRSGGSLLSQLCDSHQQLLVHPSEMRIGFPSKDAWPRFDPRDAPEHLFARLFQGQLAPLAARGYRKNGKGPQEPGRLSFDYSPSEHYRAFVQLLNVPPSDGPLGRSSLTDLPFEPASGTQALADANRERRTRRAVLDCYFESLFAAWPSGRVADPHYVVGFVPRTAAKKENVAEFFGDYPDGRLITIMRNPADWFVSLRAHVKKDGVERYSNLDKQMRLWNKMAGAALAYHRMYRRRFLLVSFRELVTDREGTMQRIAQWCGIKFDASLLRQTFTGRPIELNSNFLEFPERCPGAVLERHTLLSTAERDQISELTETTRRQLHRIGCRLLSVPGSNRGDAPGSRPAPYAARPCALSSP